MMYDCQEISLNTGAELNRQKDQLRSSERKVFSLNGKLLNSSGLVLSVQRNMKKNKIIFKIAIGVVLFILTFILVAKIF